MGEIINYVKDSFEELKGHVTWTPMMELQKMTVVVFVFSVIFALIIWLADTFLSEVFEIYFDLLK
jgi:preprotein translocase subunit SecE